MASIAEALGVDGREVAIGGATITVRPFRLRDLAELEEWAKTAIEHPIRAIVPFLGDLDPPERNALIEAAQAELANWPPAYGSPRALHVLGFTARGRKRMLWQILKRDRPGATEAEAEAILDGATEAEFTRAMHFAHGRDPDAPSPKETAPAGAANLIGAALLLGLLRSSDSEKPAS